MFSLVILFYNLIYSYFVNIYRMRIAIYMYRIILLYELPFLGINHIPLLQLMTVRLVIPQILSSPSLER